MGLMQQGRKAMEPQTKWYAAISLFIVALCFVFYAGDWMQGVVHTKSAFYLWATTPPPCFRSSGGRYCRRVAMIVLLGWKGRARHKRHFQEKIIRAWIEGKVDNQMNSAVHLAFENFGLTLGVCLRNGLPALIQTHGVPVSERSWAVIWILQPKALSRFQLPLRGEGAACRWHYQMVDVVTQVHFDLFGACLSRGFGSLKFFQMIVTSFSIDTFWVCGRGRSAQACWVLSL